MASKIIITDAGRTELINAQQTGTNAVTLSEVALGTGQYTASSSQTGLQAEFKRLASIAGGAIDNDLIHFTVLDDSTDAYSVFELGVMTDNGVLFAVYSQTTPILQKAGSSQAMLAIDIKLEDLDTTNVVIGDTNFTMPPATETQQGIVELASIDEAIDGADNARAVTPLGMNARVGIVEHIINTEVMTTINDMNARLSNQTETPFCINQGPMTTDGVPNVLSYANDVNRETEIAFEQPVLTANGTVGADKFAVSSNQNLDWAFRVFNPSNDEWPASMTTRPSDPAEITFYNPVALKIRSISLKNSSTIKKIWSHVIVYGSNSTTGWTLISEHDNAIRTAGTWVDINVDSNIAYKYFKLSFTENSAIAAVSIAQIKLNASTQGIVNENQISFRGPLVATTAYGETFIADDIADLDVSAVKASTVYIYLDRAGVPTFTTSELLVGPQEPTTAVPGEIWFQTVEPLTTYLRLVDQWYEIYLVPVGEAYLDGTGRITAVSTYPYNQNGYTVNSNTVATSSTFGLMRVASPEDETNCTCNDASVTPSNFMKMGDYRLAETDYQEGDQVECLYHADLYLVCTTAGMTSADALDTRTIEVDQSITDGTVTWVVRKRSVSFDVGDVRERDTAKPTYGLV